MGELSYSLYQLLTIYTMVSAIHLLFILSLLLPPSTCKVCLSYSHKFLIGRFQDVSSPKQLFPNYLQVLIIESSQSVFYLYWKNKLPQVTHLTVACFCCLILPTYIALFFLKFQTSVSQRILTGPYCIQLYQTLVNLHLFCRLVWDLV